MRAIKEELGDNDDDEDDVAALERKMQSAGMPSNIWKHAQRELRYDLFRNVDKGWQSSDRWTNNINSVAVKVVDSFHTMDISRALT